MRITNFITVTYFSISVVSSLDASQRGHILGTWNFEKSYLSTGPVTIEKQTCGCTTVYSTITGEGRLYFPPATSTTLDDLAQPTSVDDFSSRTDVPTPMVTTFETPGTYEIPAKTITLLDSIDTFAATSTDIGPGNHIAGGFATFVNGPTTIIRPFATVTTIDGVAKSTISVSTYVFPSAGTYTMGSQTTDTPESALWIYPIHTSYAPGVYTRPSTVITVSQTSYVVLCPYTSVKQVIAEPTEPAQIDNSLNNIVDQRVTEPSIAEPTINNSDAQEHTLEQAPAEPSFTEPLGDNLEAPGVKIEHVSAEPTGIHPSDNLSEGQHIPVNQITVGPSSEKHDDSSQLSESLSINPAAAPTQAANIEPAILSPDNPTSDAPTTSENNILGSTDGLWAITFSPYGDNGACKTADSVWADVAKIKLAGFKTIRVYSPDCSGLQNVGSAAEFHGLKLIVGIFVSETGCSGAASQVKQISDWGKWHLVELVVIGNEALFNGHSSVQELASFISSTKSTFRSAGYKGPCTTAEPLNMWQEHSSSLCDIIDVVGCNIHPFFNAGVDANNAGPFVQSQLNIVDGICPGKRGINLECGWPSAGECNGKACPGVSEQATAVSGIRTYAGNMSVMFTYTNDYWKSPGLFHVEQSFGMIALLIGDKA